MRLWTHKTCIKINSETRSPQGQKACQERKIWSVTLNLKRLNCSKQLGEASSRVKDSSLKEANDLPPLQHASLPSSPSPAPAAPGQHSRSSSSSAGTQALQAFIGYTGALQKNKHLPLTFTSTLAGNTLTGYLCSYQLILWQALMEKSMDCKENKVIFISSNKQIDFGLGRHFIYTCKVFHIWDYNSISPVGHHETNLIDATISEQAALSLRVFSPLGVWYHPV